jgi:20S proteasome alpha/beta subunit
LPLGLVVYAIGEKATDYARAKPGARTFNEIQHCVSLAYENTRRDEINIRYVRPFGYHDISELRENISKDLGEKIASDVIHDITDYDLRIELLVYGFDERGFPSTFLVDNPGAARLRETTVYWALGSGFDFAMTVLNSKISHYTKPDEQTLIYHLCEAKFAAEWDQAVGKSTSITIWYPGEHWGFINDDEIELIREMIEQERRQPIPGAANKLLGERITALREMNKIMAGEAFAKAASKTAQRAAQDAAQQ